MEGVRVAQETEVLAKAQRRRFTAAEKLRVLREADRCSKPGEVSALLRREGLYSSDLATWRSSCCEVRRRSRSIRATRRSPNSSVRPVGSRRGSNAQKG